jgi:O-antigen/teichoic acid export membrane protein
MLIFSSFSLPIARGVLQGRKQFGLFGASLVIEGVIKLGLAIVFVYIEMGVFGALYGIIFGALAGFILSMGFNLKIIKENTVNERFKDFKLQSIPYFFSMFAIFFALSLDIILAKLFFNPVQVGEYAVVSMLGKIIFFGSSAIGKVMFPLTSEKYEEGKNSFNIFKKSFLIVSTLCGLAIAAYLLFPKLIILVLYGSQYTNVYALLVYSGISLSFLSLTNLILIYGLSIDSLKKSYFLFVFILLEVLLFSLFHKSLLEYTLAFMFSNIIMFIFSFLFIKKQK